MAKRGESPKPGLNRRDTLVGSVGLAVAAAAPLHIAEAAVCTLANEQLKGPYYVDGARIRRDIAEGSKGVPMILRIALIDSRTCAPLVGAAADIWHCDAVGIYSGFTADDPDQPPKGIVNGVLPKTDTKTFLRGVQITDKAGAVEFRSIYPGWYFGRDTHVHLEVHPGAKVGDRLDTGRVCHTSQLFFPDEVGDAVARLDPYATHHLKRTRLADDFGFQTEAGPAPILKIAPLDSTDLSRGVIAETTLAVNPDALTHPPKGPSQGGPGPHRA